MTALPDSDQLLFLSRLLNRSSTGIWVVIGSAGVGQLLSYDLEPALAALAEGMPVLLYTPGLPQISHNRPLAASLAARYRELKNWGVRFTDGQQKRLITAQEAKAMAAAGQRPSQSLRT